jgi:hypothetical protein
MIFGANLNPLSQLASPSFLLCRLQVFITREQY